MLNLQLAKPNTRKLEDTIQQVILVPLKTARAFWRKILSWFLRTKDNVFCVGSLTATPAKFYLRLVTFAKSQSTRIWAKSRFHNLGSTWLTIQQAIFGLSKLPTTRKVKKIVETKTRFSNHFPSLGLLTWNGLKRTQKVLPSLSKIPRLSLSTASQTSGKKRSSALSAIRWCGTRLNAQSATYFAVSSAWTAGGKVRPHACNADSLSKASELIVSLSKTLKRVNLLARSVRHYTSTKMLQAIKTLAPHWN